MNSTRLTKEKKTFKTITEGFAYANLGRNDDDLSTEQLSEIEETRARLNEKVRNFSQNDMIRSFAGTVIPKILTSRQAWLVIFEYIIIRVLLREKIIERGDDLPDISTAALAIIGSFMSFFLVFFVSQAYARFTASYGLSMNIDARIANITYLARSALKPAEAMRLARYANALHAVAYIGLSDAYTYSNLFQPLNEKYRLLTDFELQRLNAVGFKKGGACSREIVAWMLDLLYTAFRESNARKEEGVVPIDNNTLTTMASEILQLRGSIFDMYAAAEQSIPFTYMHLLVLINGGYLILISYCIGVYFALSHSVFPDLLGAFMLACHIVFVIGMRQIGRHMIDPYGSEVQDLAVPSFLEGTIRSTRQILQGQRFIAADFEKEEFLDSFRPQLGEGYTEQTLAYATTHAHPVKGLPNYDLDAGYVSSSPVLAKQIGTQAAPSSNLKSRGSHSSPNVLKSRSIDVEMEV
eukprot:CAMPEP_0173140288 /NCGR_PEP_ID=MMETSP1105-20130129/4789_1 /TAXON_ID=2985 /ORGANISM="Ochromonas sp., Strain BG-1" /LENGTH=465 /DNA_ID=CAMNT_0014053231 /DNA_START=36 /DNA_END=1433 /DNA_ORIENTATION=+